MGIPTQFEYGATILLPCRDGVAEHITNGRGFQWERQEALPFPSPGGQKQLAIRSGVRVGTPQEIRPGQTVAPVVEEYFLNELGTGERGAHGLCREDRGLHAPEGPLFVKQGGRVSSCLGTGAVCVKEYLCNPVGPADNAGAGHIARLVEFIHPVRSFSRGPGKAERPEIGLQAFLPADTLSAGEDHVQVAVLRSQRRGGREYPNAVQVAGHVGSSEAGEVLLEILASDATGDDSGLRVHFPRRACRHFEQVFGEFFRGRPQFLPVGPVPYDPRIDRSPEPLRGAQDILLPVDVARRLAGRAAVPRVHARIPGRGRVGPERCEAQPAHDFQPGFPARSQFRCDPVETPEAHLWLHGRRAVHRVPGNEHDIAREAEVHQQPIAVSKQCVQFPVAQTLAPRLVNDEPALDRAQELSALSCFREQAVSAHGQVLDGRRRHTLLAGSGVQ